MSRYVDVGQCGLVMRVSMADGARPLAVVADLKIPNPPGDHPDWMRFNRAKFKAEADEIVTALCQHLPGGLVDQLLISLLERAASGFHVPHLKEDS